MGKFPPELLIIILIGGLLLLNFLAQRVAARQQQQQQEEMAKQAEPPAPDEPLPDIWGRTQPAPAAALPAMPVRPVAEPPIAVHARARRHGARSFLQGRSNLQRAMVVMTVLGPCRAMEPPAGDATGSSPGRPTR